ncbi:hypothetical protein GTP45_00990 [Pseudoduganella sp. FT55W]|uniref:Uncharacterized protein n=1 Tax=Duganella rivi TaxID=2666083 RepID=A0A7X4K9Z5_9BURK|nr:hypothetical protein [Duganella rivi]MYM65407.1 hypothetical protein [Duganella rivi]
MQAENLSKIVEASSKSLALLATVCVGFSVIYDFGYLYGLGLSLREVPTSFSDHLRSAIIWLPSSAIFVVFEFFIAFYFSKRDAITAQKNNITPSQKDAIDNIATGFGASVNVLLWVLMGDRFIWAGALGMGMFVMLFAFMVKTNIPTAYQSAFMYAALAILGACVLFGMAETNATSLLDEKVEDELVLKNKDATQTIKGRVLRRFERSLIIVNEQRIISIINPDDLVRVNFHRERNGNTGLLCKYLGKACPQDSNKTGDKAEVLKPQK